MKIRVEEGKICLTLACSLGYSTLIKFKANWKKSWKWTGAWERWQQCAATRPPPVSSSASPSSQPLSCINSSPKVLFPFAREINYFVASGVLPHFSEVPWTTSFGIKCFLILLFSLWSYHFYLKDFLSITW